MLPRDTRTGPDHSITQVNTTSPPPLLVLLRSWLPNPSHFPSYWTASFYTKKSQKEQKEKQSLKEIQRLISSILHPEVNLFEGKRRSTLLSSLYFRIASELIHNGFAGPRVLGGPVRANRELNEAKVDREETEMSPWRSHRQNWKSQV